LVLSKVGLAAVGALFALAPGLAGQDKKLEWRDLAEYELYKSAANDPNAASRLSTLEKWKFQYPQTDYIDVRLDMFLISYQQLTRPRDAFNMAIEILQTRPNQLRALSAVVGSVYQFKDPTATDLEITEKAANNLLTNLDSIYAPANKPPETKDADWAKLKPEMKIFAQRTMTWIAVQRKDHARTEAEALKTLALDPNQGQVSFWLAGAMMAQRATKPETYPAALFHYARAAAFDGPGCLVATDRKNIRDFLVKAYSQYHGSADGIEELLALAKNNVMPPREWAGIRTAADIEKEKQAAEEAAAKANPMLALWRSIKRELTGTNGQEYFENRMKGALVPGNVVEGVTKFKGKLISMTPATRPKELVVAIEKSETPDVMLKLDGVLPGKMESGAEIEFEGIAAAFSKEPFMVTFDVEKSKIVGWTGKNTPAPTTKKPGAAGKKKAG
jgi:hypothetical protein